MEKKNYLRSIGGVMIIMLAGKLLALAANQYYLSYFGSGNPQLNVYSWAINVPNYIFQSFGTALTSVVIPIFAALLVQNKKKEADRFASNVICVSGALTLLLIGVGTALSFVLPYTTDFDDKSYAGMALRIMMPVMLFYGMCYIYQGILQSHGKYRSAALSNLPNGIVIIIYVAFFAKRFGVTGLLVATLIGFFLQFAVLIIPAARAGFRPSPVFDLRDPDLRQAGKMTVPIILGACAYQLNMYFNITMMSNVDKNSVSLFTFVQTLIISSVMTMVLAITSVMYPTLSKHAAQDDREGFKSTLSSTAGGTIFILLPLSVGLIVLREPFLALVSMHGKMTYADVKTEASFLLMYSLCIVFLGIKEIADRAFYSMKKTRISAITGVLIMAVNVALGFVLSKFTPLGAAGIPLAYSTAVICGTAFLVIMLRREIGAFGYSIAENAIKSAAASAIMGAAVYLVYRLISGGGVADASIKKRLVCVAVPTLCGIAVYFVAALVLKIPAFSSVAAKLRGKRSATEDK